MVVRIVPYQLNGNTRATEGGPYFCYAVCIHSKASRHSILRRMTGVAGALRYRWRPIERLRLPCRFGPYF